MTKNSARLVIDRVAAALEGVKDVIREEDGSLRLDHDGMLVATQSAALSPGLVLLSVTAVLQWDRPEPDVVAAKAYLAGPSLQFGSLSVVKHDGVADVLMRYTFPASGLRSDALRTMLLLVLDEASVALARLA